MAVTDEIRSRLRRTMLSIFRIGDINVKDSSGVVELRNEGDTAYADGKVNRLQVGGDNASNAVILDAPAGLGASPTFTLPGADGSTGQVLSTNGSGTLSFADVAANADLQQVEAFTEGTSSPLAIFTPPDNAHIMQVIIELTTAAAAAGASVSVGENGGTVDAYLTTADVDMEETGKYFVSPLIDVGATPGAVELTITPGAQTFAGNVFVKYSNAS